MSELVASGERRVHMTRTCRDIAPGERSDCLRGAVSDIHVV
jgi:hypothetical protein